MIILVDFVKVKWTEASPKAKDFACACRQMNDVEAGWPFPCDELELQEPAAFPCISVINELLIQSDSIWFISSGEISVFWDSNRWLWRNDDTVSMLLLVLSRKSESFRGFNRVWCTVAARLCQMTLWLKSVFWSEWSQVKVLDDLDTKLSHLKLFSTLFNVGTTNALPSISFGIIDPLKSCLIWDTRDQNAEDFRPKWVGLDQPGVSADTGLLG